MVTWDLDGQHRTWGVLNNTLRGASEHCVLESGSSMRREYDEVNPYPLPVLTNGLPGFAKYDLRHADARPGQFSANEFCETPSTRFYRFYIGVGLSPSTSRRYVLAGGQRRLENVHNPQFGVQLLG